MNKGKHTLLQQKLIKKIGIELGFYPYFLLNTVLLCKIDHRNEYGVVVKYGLDNSAIIRGISVLYFSNNIAPVHFVNLSQ
jgi:hypothetical protein